jgi:hypothetical protein
MILLSFFWLNNRTPILSHFAEALNGATSIRALNVASLYEKEIMARIDNNQRCWTLVCRMPSSLFPGCITRTMHMV